VKKGGSEWKGVEKGKKMKKKCGKREKKRVYGKSERERKEKKGERKTV
jgi:hypothetical protein